MPRFRTCGDESKRRLAARLFAIGAMFAFCYGILMSRAVYFHLKDNKEVSRVAMRQYRTAVKQSTERGKILDSNGRELAINLAQESIYADPRFIKDTQGVAKGLSLILGLDYTKIFKLISSNRKFVWIKRRVSPEEIQKVSNAKFSGIYIMNEKGRFYPNGELASSVVGTVNVDAEGLSGIEYEYNDVLLTHNAENMYRRDARGHLYLSPAKSEEENVTANVELTIDKTIQYIVERELKGMVERTHAKSGVAIVLDANTGDVWAMTNVPLFNPNSFDQYSPEAWKNKAISDVYEPGSTFKAITIANALNNNVVTENEIFDCGNGKLKVGKMVVNDAHPHKKLSAADVIKVSSNIGAARIEAKVGKEQTHRDIQNFGFGEETGIDLPGEAKGLLSSPQSWSDLQFVTIAFGQGIGATPIQMSMAFAALANGGKLLKPHVVKRIVKQNGEVFYERKIEVRGQSITPATSALMRRLLERVVNDGGTGILAASGEYNVAGKTGTAQKASSRGGYLKDKYYASFIGFAPAEDPRIVVYVGIDEPHGYYYGGQVAAPVFRNIVEGILHYLNIPAQKGVVEAKRQPDLSSLAEGPYFVSRQENIIKVPPLTEAKLQTISEHKIDNEADVIVHAEMVRVINVAEGQWKIPDFRGLTMKGVLKAVGDANINVKFVGSGVAVKQNPRAGSIISEGEECLVEFKKIL